MQSLVSVIVGRRNRPTKSGCIRPLHRLHMLQVGDPHSPSYCCNHLTDCCLTRVNQHLSCFCRHRTSAQIWGGARAGEADAASAQGIQPHGSTPRAHACAANAPSPCSSCRQLRSRPARHPAAAHAQGWGMKFGNSMYLSYLCL